MCKLLWTLSIGDSNDHAHKIGMGKPLGMGSIKINIAKVMIRTLSLNNGFNYTIAEDTQYQDRIKNEDTSLLGCNTITLDGFKKITDYKNIQENIQYPENEGSMGKHYEWFGANKTDQFSPTINQTLEPLTTDNNPALSKYRKF